MSTQYMTTFKNVLGTPQTIIPLSDIEVIFNKIPDLHHAHKLFVHDLSPKVEQWSADQQVAKIFQTLVSVSFVNLKILLVILSDLQSWMQ